MTAGFLGAPRFEQFHMSRMFRAGEFCKIYAIESPQQSGEILHSHDYYQIWYVTRGECTHFIENQKHEMTAGDAFILPPNLMHRIEIGDKSRILCCDFFLRSSFSDAADIVFQKFREITNGMSFLLLFQKELHDAKEKFSLSTRAQTRIEKLMNSMLEEYQDADLLFEDVLQAQLMQLLLLFMREYAQNPGSKPADDIYGRYKNIVDDSLEYIRTHYNEPLTLESVCRRAMMSKTYFCYLFKLQTHQTFVEYLLQLRIEASKQLLESTDLSVTRIGEEVGFQSSPHFTRTFRKLTGLTPREYRNRAAGRTSG